MLFASPIVCNFQGMLWEIAPRMSVFLVAVLSISRTISLLFPFRRIKKVHIVMPVVSYLILQTVQATIPYWFGAAYTYHNESIGKGFMIGDSSCILAMF